jgi:hypothetical protein
MPDNSVFFAVTIFLQQKFEILCSVSEGKNTQILKQRKPFHGEA